MKMVFSAFFLGVLAVRPVLTWVVCAAQTGYDSGRDAFIQESRFP
jgi:hypothetical protein